MGFLCAQPSWTRALCVALLAATAPFAGAHAPAEFAASPLLPVPFRDAIERGIVDGAYRSLAVGLIDGARQATYYFGHRDDPASKPADDDSLFEIGAVGEIFTSVLLAQAAIEGKLRLSDPVERFLPPQFPFADPGTGKITLAQLATQHSGLPAQPQNLFPDDPDDPYADYASEDLLALLALRRARDETDDGYAYSALNAGFLGFVLGRVYRMPFAELLLAKVAAPLELTHVSFADPPGLLQGYAFGTKAKHWHYGVLAGAAGLRANLPDLLAFLQCNLRPTDSPLRAALLLARQPRAAGAADRIGLGWNVRERLDGADTWPLVWRASRTGGFASFVGFRIDQQKAIVLLGNAAEDVAALGIAWLGGAAPPPIPHAPASAPSYRPEDYPGLYQVAPGSTAVVRARAGALSLQMPGELPRRLRAADRDVFVTDDGALGVTFVRNLDEIDGLVLHAAGGNVSASRLSLRAPKITRAVIETTGGAPAGDYRLDGSTWIRVAESKRGTNLQWTLGERRSIFAYAPDRYADADGALDLQFHRDAHGRVKSISLDLAGVQREATPLLRAIP
ncbi:MAG: serine hydrolase domain-containing protein [Rudaea sp.]|uniref:serine hydrolase domain-containing protein n=1 Tax=Rudaea sp. TaxID=2136325 RepID=UPI0039E25755